MAKPKYHAWSMFIFAFLLWFLGISTDLLSFVINSILLISFGAVIPDLDHINFKDPIGWAIKFVKHENVALPKGTKLWLHTFSGSIAVVISLILFGIYVPTLLPPISCLLLILAFTIHMVIDGANRANNFEQWQNEGSYLPWVIHHKIMQYCPRWLTYYYSEGKEEEKKERNKYNYPRKSFIR